MLSPTYLSRCVDEHDWVRNELKLALKLNKYFICINPDNTFDGIPDGSPADIAQTIKVIQHSEISFGQHLDASINLLIQHRIQPIIGAPSNYSGVELVSKGTWLKKIVGWFHQKDKNINILLEKYMPQKVDFDIFISYRRIDGRDHARNIQQALKAHGYKDIFFDYDSIQKGEFTNRIIDAIYSCTDFILVLSPKSMKRCVKKRRPCCK